MNKDLAYSTVASYVSVLNFVHKMAGFKDFSENFAIKKSLQGYRKLGAKADTRLPITPSILKHLVQSLLHTGFSKFLQVLLKAMYLLAFHAFLRVGEITFSGKAKNIIQYKDLNFVYDQTHQLEAVELNMINFKHHEGKSRQKLHIKYNLSNPEMCPVLALKEYCQVRGSHEGPLFCFMDGKPIPRQYFTKQLQTSLHWAGCSIK